MVKCADQSLYTGITNDLAARIKAHNAGTGAKYTRGRGPVDLVYHETQPDRSAASKRERGIKAMSKTAKRQLFGAPDSA